jgi:hypothetical protein
MSDAVEKHKYEKMELEMSLESSKKANILCKIVEIDQNLIKGCDEYIQFMKLVYHIMMSL